MPDKQLTVLFTPLDAFGHINACTGLGQALQSRGHRILFALPTAFKCKVSKYGFEEVFYQKPKIGKVSSEGVLVTSEDAQQIQKQWTNGMSEAFKKGDFLETMRQMVASGNNERLIDELIHINPQLADIINAVNPDVIVNDNLLVAPAIETSGIPFVLLYSPNPLFGLEHPDLPPGGIGLPTNKKSVFAYYHKAITEMHKGIFAKWNRFLEQEDSPSRLTSAICQPSPYANFYMLAKELDYFEHVKRPKTWHRFDHFIRKNEEFFEIPERLRLLPGKLIYFSLGSIGVLVTELVQRLLDILAKSSNRFVISSGPNTEKMRFYGNMHAESFLPQTSVLPLVDLVITHGGNNTVTETLFFGKPMIVLPLLGDQPDNAQRIVEKGFGLRFLPWQVTEGELLGAIERLLADLSLKRRLEIVSKRMQSSDSQLKAARLVEKLAAEFRNEL